MQKTMAIYAPFYSVYGLLYTVKQVHLVDAGWAIGGIIVHQRWQQENSNSSAGNILLRQPTSRADLATRMMFALPFYLYPTDLGWWDIIVIAVLITSKMIRASS